MLGETKTAEQTRNRRSQERTHKDRCGQLPNVPDNHSGVYQQDGCKQPDTKSIGPHDTFAVHEGVDGMLAALGRARSRDLIFRGLAMCIVPGRVSAIFGALIIP